VRRLRHAVVAAATLVVGVGAGASAANAASVVATLRSPNAIDQSTRTVIYYFDLVAGDQDERVSLVLTPPEFATVGGLDEGQSVDGPRQVVMAEGPGTVGSVVSDPDFQALCSDRDDAFHGYATGKATIDLALPAGAHSRLAVRYAVGRRGPWTDSDFSVKFALQNQLVGTYDAASPLFGGPTALTIGSSVFATDAIPVVAAGVGHKIGAHLVLTTSPKGTLGDAGPPRVLASGKSVRVSGRLLPAARGKKVELQWAKSGGARRLAKRVTTTSGGRFSATLRPPGRGVYELWAKYPSQAGTLVSDTTSCPVAYRAK
jgi:hypothetical protein